MNEAIAALQEYKDSVFAREVDGLMILTTRKGEQWFRLNPTAAMMIRLVIQDLSPSEVVNQVMTSYSVSRATVIRDLERFSRIIVETIDDPDSHWQELEPVPWRWEMALPFMGELTLTRRCQNRCRKCYMSAVTSADQAACEEELSQEELVRIIDRFALEIQVRGIIFTGGEPTLRPELLELIAYAKQRGLRTNLITNGINCGLDPNFAKKLADAGLDTAQVSLDGTEARLHNSLVGKNAFDLTLAGLIALKEAGVFAYVNSTLCRPNSEDLLGMPKFLAEHGFTTWSANGLIPSGNAVGNLSQMGFTYSEFAVWVPRLKKAAEVAGIDFTWLLPIPYCLLPLPAVGFEEKGCTAANIIAIVNSKGQFVACNNLPEESLGNMLDNRIPFSSMWNGKAARWWRERQFVPEPCKECVFRATCCGACPQYWRNFGDFKEIARARNCKLPPSYTQDWRQKFEQRPRVVL